MSSSKTEKPTQKKLKDAAQKGKSFKSKDLIISLLTLSGVEYIVNFYSLSDISDIVNGAIINGFNSTYHEYAKMVLWTGLKLFLPLFLLCLLSSVLPTLLQTGFMLSTKALKINFGAFNPINGVKKLFSLRSLKDVIKSCLYLACFIVALQLFWDKNKFLLLSQVNGLPDDIFVVWGELFQSLISLCLSCIVVVIIFDALAEFFLHIKDNKMDKQEVKREVKEQDGNPEIKHKRKGLHKELLSEQLKSDIKSSKVIVANPTHIAVGIYLNPEVIPIPFISVLETNQRALAVRAYAKKVGVPIVENIKLARQIFKTHSRYSFVSIEELDEVMRLLTWLEEVENAWSHEIPNQ